MRAFLLLMFCVHHFLLCGLFSGFMLLCFVMCYGVCGIGFIGCFWWLIGAASFWCFSRKLAELAVVTLASASIFYE